MASLHFKFASMNSGKTTQLIQAQFNYLERGMNPLVMTPSVDTRGGVGVIKARVGLELHVEAFGPSDDLYAIVSQKQQQGAIDVFIVDEAQFLTKQQVYQLAAIVDRLSIPVIAYGLKSDYKGELFEGSYHLLCLADKFEELKSICWCGKKAHMNAKFDDTRHIIKSGDQVDIGGNDMYISLCRQHYIEGVVRNPNH